MDPSRRAREDVLDAFRRWGYLQADLDALGRLPPLPVPELEEAGPGFEEGRARYCGTLAAEFMHIPDPERRGWVIERMESDPPEPDRAAIFGVLARAQLFETALQRRYLGTKRFSIEGVSSLLPFLREAARALAERGAEELVLGMSHRGRLNVMANFLGVPVEDIFAEFEDADPESVLGGGDVKYHLGARGRIGLGGDRSLDALLVANPSHVEAVDPLVLGVARARQARLGDAHRTRVVPLLLHGDGAFAGQGIAAETLNLAELPGYAVGGAIHVVVNNLVAFTTRPEFLHSSRFATDLARRLPVPILHVNAADPEAAVRAAGLAAGFRNAFQSDVVVDLIGHRRWGHSEVEDPKYTQPALYARIEALPPLWKAYAERIGMDGEAVRRAADEISAAFDRAHERARASGRRPDFLAPREYWSGFSGGPYDPAGEPDTGVGGDRLREIAEALARLPEGFRPYPKAEEGLRRRAAMGRGEAPVDWGTAEALAFGSLLREGVPVRLSGEDSRRGTFSQRHVALYDRETEEPHLPLERLPGARASFECHDSPLSEAAVLGFEYGFSLESPEALVLWEAQFGDFANGAQPILDQFVSAAEDKWGLLSGLVLLLPHGYEGQGPEHSSARLERFLQLSAEDNLQVCQPSTAAQYFHLLRRQALRRWRKPLVVLTPKSMLRNPAACSPVDDLSRGRFRRVLPEAEIADAERVIVAGGKLVHELRRERGRRKAGRAAVVSLEEVAPFPAEELRRELSRHPGARRVVWAQEEPANMGAAFFVVPRLRPLCGEIPVSSVARPESASPATGSLKAHAIEQARLLDQAFGD